VIHKLEACATSNFITVSPPLDEAGFFYWRQLMLAAAAPASQQVSGFGADRGWLVATIAGAKPCYPDSSWLIRLLRLLVDRATQRVAPTADSPWLIRLPRWFPKTPLLP